MFRSSLLPALSPINPLLDEMKQRNFAGAIKLILSSNVDKNTVTSNGKSLLHLAVEHAPRYVPALLQLDIDCNLVDEKKQTALQILIVKLEAMKGNIARYDYIQYALAFLQHGAVVTAAESRLSFNLIQQAYPHLTLSELMDPINLANLRQVLIKNHPVVLTRNNILLLLVARQHEMKSNQGEKSSLAKLPLDLVKMIFCYLAKDAATTTAIMMGLPAKVSTSLNAIHANINKHEILMSPARVCRQYHELVVGVNALEHKHPFWDYCCGKKLTKTGEIKLEKFKHEHDLESLLKTKLALFAHKPEQQLAVLESVSGFELYQEEMKSPLQLVAKR